jgi:hypothetical protein
MKKLSRRQILRGLAGSSIALPLLECERRPAWAQGMTGAGHPKRLLIFFTPNGTIPENFWPKAGPTPESFELSPILQPLEDFQSKMLVLRGIDMKSASVGHGHEHQRGMGTLLVGRPVPKGDMGSAGGTSGWGDGISVDQEIANHIGESTRVRSLELGIRADHYYGSHVLTRISYRGPAQPLPPENDPLAAFDRIFSDAGTDMADLEHARLRQQSMLDTVKQQFDVLRGRVSAHDQARLEAHLQLVRELELELSKASSPLSGCQPPQPPESLAIDDENVMPQVLKAHIALTAAAFACDATRVVSIQLSNAKNFVRYPWLNSFSNGHDDLSHAGDSNKAARLEFTQRHTWHAEQLADLLRLLQALPEGDGSVLDNTLVFWCNELSTGNNHSHIEMPFVLLGGAGGKLRTGRYLTYDSEPHNNLLLSMLHAFDIEVPSFGDPAFCTGPLAGLT